MPAQLFAFLYYPGPPTWVCHHLVMALPREETGHSGLQQSLIKKMPHRHAHRTVCWRQILNYWDSLFPEIFKFVSNWQKLTSTLSKHLMYDQVVWPLMSLSKVRAMVMHICCRSLSLKYFQSSQAYSFTHLFKKFPYMYSVNHTLRNQVVGPVFASPVFCAASDITHRKDSLQAVDLNCCDL